MRYIIFFLALVFILSCSKEKNKTCYDCTAISAGTTYSEEVCTDDGVPNDELPQSVPSGTLTWHCVEQ